MDNVIKLPVMTKLDLKPKEILQEIAKDDSVTHCFVICMYENQPSTYHSTKTNTPEVMHELQKFIHKMYNGDYE